METSPGRFSLLLRDLDAWERVFEAANHTGNGYSWEAIALHLIESTMSEIGDKIVLDSESDMFCANSSDRGALEALGAILAEAARSSKRLSKLIASVPPTLWID